METKTRLACKGNPALFKILLRFEELQIQRTALVQNYYAAQRACEKHLGGHVWVRPLCDDGRDMNATCARCGRGEE